MMNILIVDDHAVVRKGIKQILSEEAEVTTLGEASNSEELFSQLYEKNWDIVILDITLPGKNGLDILIELKRRKPDIKVLILTMHPEEEIAIRALKTGASGYLNKDSVPGELLSAVKKIFTGSKYISSSLGEKLALYLDKDVSKLAHELLSNREFQILCLIASGNSLTDIAKELLISVKTVSTYRTRILEKMNMKSNVELTHYAIKNKLVTSM
ncbi:MAG TPA: response regulator transcription factor [Ignavibacteria bacterium]|jgi:DNA-binding NarL/FixJ family response regulator